MKKCFEKWLHFHYDFIPARSLSIFRLCFATYFLCFPIAFYSKVSSGSLDNFEAINLITRVTAFPEPLFFQILDVAIVILMVSLFFGFKSKWSSILLGILFIVGNSFLFSLSKINHGSLFPILTLFIMPFTNWERYYSIDEKKGFHTPVVTWPVTILSFVIGFGMMTAGIQKLGGGLGWLNSKHQALKYHFFKSVLNGREGVFADYFSQVSSTVWEILDFLTVIFEMGFLIVIFHYRIFRLWLIIALFFHLIVFLMMDITFSQNAIVYLAFFDLLLASSFFRLKRAIETLDRVLTMRFYIGTLMFFLLLQICFGDPYLSHYMGLNKITKMILPFSFALLAIFPTFSNYYLKGASGRTTLK